MSSDALKVKIGAAWVSYKGTDLGYTQGGIGISIDSRTAEVVVDDQGPVPQAVFSLGKRIQISVPLAESDYNRIVGLLGGSNLSVNHNYGDDLLDGKGDLVITPLKEPDDFVTFKDAIVSGQVSTRYAYDQQRTWVITFVAYGESSSIMEFNEAS